MDGATAGGAESIGADFIAATSVLIAFKNLLLRIIPDVLGTKISGPFSPTIPACPADMPPPCWKPGKPNALNRATSPSE